MIDRSDRTKGLARGFVIFEIKDKTVDVGAGIAGMQVRQSLINAALAAASEGDTVAPAAKPARQREADAFGCAEEEDALRLLGR
ncbi:hypothetical protein AWL63_20485 [Sphingomonas panacis]|uniref:Uncharacterized protein n=1 Tax=Sphingomonas panacis TaxID=1560345 RepID=A0A1B3ZEW8_9SPHN|nr:hypothetical protein AWL63_20485 [Sphingomonas panacis]